MKKIIFKLHSNVLESNPNVNLNREGGIIMDNVTIFNFKEDWKLVEPHLYEPEILEQLDKGMSEYADGKTNGNMPLWDRKNGIGSWEYNFIDDIHYEEAIALYAVFLDKLYS